MKTGKQIQDSKSKTKSTPKGKDISNCRALRPNRRDTTPNEITKQQKIKSPTSLSFTKTDILAAKHCRLLPLRPEALCCRADKNRNMDFHLLSKTLGRNMQHFFSLTQADTQCGRSQNWIYVNPRCPHKFVSFFSSLSNLTKNNLLWFHLDIC